MRSLIALAIVLATGFALSAAAQTVQVPADGLIAARQSLMDLQIASAATLKRAVDAKATDIKPYKSIGTALAASGNAIPTLFPVGTEQGHNTKALPAIWSDRAGFEKAAASLSAAGTQLANAADAGDQPGFEAAFQAVGKACGTCHNNYRAK